MLLPWKKNFLEARPRSTPPDATLRALDEAPPPPTGIIKVDSHLDNGQAGHGRKKLKLRLLALRNIKVLPTTPGSPVGSIIACERVPSSVPTSEGLEDSIGAHFVGTLPDHTAAEGAFLQTPPDASRLESIPHPVAFPSSAPLVADAASHDLSAPATTSKAIQPNLSNISQLEPAHALSTTLSSTSCSNILLPLKCIGPECYIALDTSVEEKLQLKSNPLLQKKLRSFLKSLKLKDPAVVIDCVAASTTPERSKLKATILFLCLDSDQQKIISSSLRQLNSKDLEVVPLADYQYAVLVQDTRFCSSDCGFPSCPGSLSGRGVEATFHNGISLGQALCKLSGASVDSRCTLGGLVVFGGSAYALTTSHAFLGRSATFQPAQESERFQIVGNIHSYNFTGTSNLSLELSDEKDAASVCTYDQDWALIRVRSYLYGLNTFKPPGTADIISVEGFASGDELLHGAVHVITASSGIREGYLSSSFAYWEIGSSCFEVRTVFMENPLHDGDSGSWVIVQGKLCGYIISRVVGKPWGYMLPIQPVIEDICKNLALDTESVKVISRTLLDELQQSKRVAAGLSSFDDATFNHQSGTHHVQLGSPPSATAPLTPVLPSSETFHQLSQLITINRHGRVFRSGRNLVRFPTPTTTFIERAYVYRQGIRLGLIILALWISVFITNVDTYMVATAIPQITNHFGSLEDIGWYASAYLLAVASCRTSCKRLYAFFPIKWMFVLYVFIFGVGNLICGTARSSTVLIIGRAVAGAGSAGVFPGFGIIITHCMPPKKRELHDGYLGVIYAIAAITGPIIGGALTSNVSWRWCFYINSLAASVAIILIVCCLKLQTVATEHWKDRARGIDILGLVVLMPAIVCLLLALQWGGTRYPWANSKIIALLALFGVLSCCYAIVQGMKVKHSTILSAILRERSLLAIAWFSFGLGSSISMVTYYLPIWFQVVKGVSALKSGIMNLPLILTIVIASTLSILIVLRSRYYAPLMLISSILSATGFGMLSTLTLESRFGAWVGYQVLAGFGIGLGIPMSFTATKLVWDPNVASAAISVCLFMQATGGAVFVSVGLNIFINKFVTSLGVHSADLPAVLSSGLTNFGTAIGSPDDVKLVNSSSLAYSFIAGAAIAAASLFGSLIVCWKSLMLARARYND